MPTTDEAMKLIMAQAKALEGDDFELGQPQHVLSGEAVDVSKFAAKYWKARRDKQTGAVLFPGLELAGMKQKLPETIGTEILGLREAFEQKHTDYLLTVDPKGEQSPLKRGKEVVSEILLTLKWLFDDGVEDEKDERLAKVVAAHAADPQSMDAVASQLTDFQSLAEHYRADLSTIETFDIGLLDEAKELASKLRERAPQGKETNVEEAKALELRNRVGTLLLRKMNIVRAAARLVFRNHPEVIREATSAYERRKRAEARRKKNNEG